MKPEVQKLLHSFFEKSELKSFPKGAIVVKPHGEKVFFLTKGVVRMFGLSKEKDELTLNIYKPSSLFPVSLIFDVENKYTFDCLTEVQGYFTPKKDLERFIKMNPPALFDLLERIYQGFDGFFMHIEALLVRDAHHRIITQLILYARRFGQRDGNVITFEWHITHSQLASQTGLARESVTREIKKLQNKGFIGYSGKKLCIYDLPRLEEALLSYSK